MLWLYITLGCLAGVALVAAFVWFSNNCIHVSKYKIKNEKAPESGVKIVHLSDLHGKAFGRGNRVLLKKIAALSPDFIAVTGDIIHKYRERDISVALNTVKELCKIAPVYYVSGNHEMRSTRYRQLKKSLQEAGACVLDDECVNAFGIDVCGVNCAHIKSGKFFNLAEGEGFKLLLAHLPQYMERYALAGYDAALCGHAHGGQWRIPFTRIGIYAPGQGLFPKYTSGVHSCGDMRQVISRGLGNSQCPLRLFNRPEIVVVEIFNSLLSY
ncbi:MAG: metallophosphoesterase family protein [Clostridia bacterium]|nr:metallophosphoesterase family protein [Clostridia bacterium]